MMGKGPNRTVSITTITQGSKIHLCKSPMKKRDLLNLTKCKGSVIGFKSKTCISATQFKSKQNIKKSIEPSHFKSTQNLRLQKQFTAVHIPCIHQKQYPKK